MLSQLKVTNVIASGDQASVELQADSICNNGMPSKLILSNYFNNY